MHPQETLYPNEQHQTYFNQLDGLRAVAVTMVVFSHWAGYHENLWTDNLFWFNGEVGVKMFFIISGFLITGILLQERTRAEHSQWSAQVVLKNFYIRRFLRIFPAYYATIFIALLLQHPDMVASWKWHVTYLSNFLFAIRGEYLGDVSHFWSLAVEEQFYLIWPIAILFLPQRMILPWIILCICVAPVFRYVTMFIIGENDVTVSVLPISSFDCLSAGALLAYFKSAYTSDTARYKCLKIVTTVTMLCALSFVIFNLFVHIPSGYNWHAVFVSRLLLVPALLGIVLLVLKRSRGIVGKLLESRAFMHIGKISYGIYLFHFFVPGATYWLLEEFGWTPDVMVVLLINVFILIALASASWYFFENPINALKRYFPYGAKTRVVKDNIKLELK